MATIDYLVPENRALRTMKLDVFEDDVESESIRTAAVEYLEKFLNCSLVDRTAEVTAEYDGQYFVLPEHSIYYTNEGRLDMFKRRKSKGFPIANPEYAIRGWINAPSDFLHSGIRYPAANIEVETVGYDVDNVPLQRFKLINNPSPTNIPVQGTKGKLEVDVGISETEWDVFAKDQWVRGLFLLCKGIYDNEIRSEVDKATPREIQLVKDHFFTYGNTLFRR